MNQILPKIAITAIGISVFIISAVCWHSVEEIHYLKSFYPRQFSVEESFYAAEVELIKILIISIPLIIIIATAFCLLFYWKQKP